jgi:hypothetical protein
VIHKSELRSLSASAFPASVFAGTWRLQITPDAYRLTRPRFRVTEDLRAVPGRLSISATPAPVGAFNCYRNSDRLTEKGDAAASYDFESGATLALIAREDPCPLRRLLLERRWKVAG